MVEIQGKFLSVYKKSSIFRWIQLSNFGEMHLPPKFLDSESYKS
jgi:hypothetical protein